MGVGLFTVNKYAVSLRKIIDFVLVDQLTGTGQNRKKQKRCQVFTFTDMGLLGLQLAYFLEMD